MNRKPWQLLFVTHAALASARSLWSSKPATHGPRDSDEYILKTAYPLGNGELGALPFGPPGEEKLLLNINSLWSGGPFEVVNYTGGNPDEEKYSVLPDIRSRIFENGTGEMSELTGSGANYGHYRALGNLTVAISDIEDTSDYRRTLDLKTGVHNTTFRSNEQQFESLVFCSYPDDVCVYNLSSDDALPTVSISLGNQLVSQDLIDTTCDENGVEFHGVTQKGPPEGMKYTAVARLSSKTDAKTSCSDDNVLKITPAENQRSVSLVIAAGTNYDSSKGNAEDQYSFKGSDPYDRVSNTADVAAAKEFSDLLENHNVDFSALESAFSLDIPGTNTWSDEETAGLISSYSVDGPENPFLEALIFDLSRYLLISSSRDRSLPANLQGLWNSELEPAWSSDYHTNINLQMNYWVADQTGLQKTEASLWNYMQSTWVPRGSETAKLLYNASGWVVHNEVNIFGHTGMKEDPNWANYPLAAAWMMQHVWDYFDYTQDTTWLGETGYPLIKGIAEFWISQLQDDDFTKDNSLVALPCNSPEHGPTTFGCAHWQQEIYQVFEAILTGASIIEDDDEAFIDTVKSTMNALDKGLHFTSWGGIKEWKIPDSFGYDTQNRHRHLSHLTGWYPGYSISSFLGGYRNATIQSAVETTLDARGNGTASDADAGWAKVWRSACWARLNNTEKAYSELRYALDRNFAANGFSMYTRTEAPFQIDANFGFGGAVLSMLVVDLPLPYDSEDEVRTIVLGPAIPAAWGGGNVRGLRIRGGGTVYFEWDEEGLVTKASLENSRTKVVLVNKEGAVLAERN